MLKLFTCWLLALFPLLAIAQYKSFKIDASINQGVLLDKGWKYKAGDSAVYANIGYNDSLWQAINPTADIFKLPEITKDGKIYWFRMQLSVDTALNKQLIMMVEQSGASEIYLNGKIIYSAGVLSTNPDKIKAYNPQQKIIALNLQKGPAQLLAVRYAFQPGISYTTMFAISNKCLSIEIMPTENGFSTINKKQTIVSFNIVMATIFIVLFILYFAFYLFYSAEKTNLYFSIYALLSSVGYLINVLGVPFNYVENWYYIFNFLLDINIALSLFLLLAIYKLFRQQKGPFFWAVCAFGVACIPMGALIYGWGWLFFGIGFNITIGASILVVAIKAIRKNIYSAWIILTGSLIFFVSWSLFIFCSNIRVDLLEYAQYFFAISELSIPLSVAIYIGFDFAKTTNLLKYKLSEVEQLSAEKATILASQNEMLEKQVKERTSALNESLNVLKSTQKQLIQSEKMASLGELTAGIAHEIQNPLNFVNNFSEVSNELVDELVSEKTKMKGERDEQLEDELLADIKQNLEKINHHGKRADAIVKGMLQHSRKSEGKKELTDINALCDEYLRLAYHGLRAKDKSFNATIKTDFDTSIEKINILPQDVGRVALNLLNNAFYAVNEKAKTAGDGYQTTIALSTKKQDNAVIITVADNGNGIPQTIVDKIFQPFFTTKPTGQGTGLGLSLSYDIIKAHGGEIKVETKDGEGTVFTMQLPL